jgi:hypothetical protein
MSLINLELYFSPIAPTTVIDYITGTNNTTIYETLSGNLYTDSTMTTIAGRINISQTIFNILNLSELFDTTGQATIFFPDGTIMFSISGQTVKTPTGSYIFPTSEYTVNIQTATGEYVSNWGEIILTIYNSPDYSVQTRTLNISVFKKDTPVPPEEPPVPPEETPVPPEEPPVPPEEPPVP